MAYLHTQPREVLHSVLKIGHLRGKELFQALPLAWVGAQELHHLVVMIARLVHGGFLRLRSSLSVYTIANMRELLQRGVIHPQTLIKVLVEVKDGQHHREGGKLAFNT